jgi:hypothetical protein
LHGNKPIKPTPLGFHFENKVVAACFFAHKIHQPHHVKKTKPKHQGVVPLKQIESLV